MFASPYATLYPTENPKVVAVKIDSGKTILMIRVPKIHADYEYPLVNACNNNIETVSVPFWSVGTAQVELIDTTPKKAKKAKKYHFFPRQQARKYVSNHGKRRTH